MSRASTFGSGSGTDRPQRATYALVGDDVPVAVESSAVSQQRLLRETAALRRANRAAATTSSNEAAPPATASTSSRENADSSLYAPSSSSTRPTTASSSSLPLEMPRAYDADAELARRLQSEEDAVRRRESDDARLARSLFVAERVRVEASEADARLARELQAAEQALEQRQRADQLTAAELARHEQLEAEERDATLARTLQREEERSSLPLGGGRQGFPSPPPARVQAPGLQARPSSSFPDDYHHNRHHHHLDNEDNNDDDMMNPIDDEPGLDRAAAARSRASFGADRMFAEASRLRSLRSGASLGVLSSQRRSGTAAAASAASVNVPPNSIVRAPLTRDQLIQRLRQMQGAFYLDTDLRARRSAESTRSATIAADGPSPSSSSSSSSVMHDDDSVLMSDEDAEAQRRAFELYAQQHRARESQGHESGMAASSPDTGYPMVDNMLGLLGTMMHRFAPTHVSRFVDARLGLGGDPAAAASAGDDIDIDHMSYEDLLQLEEMLGSVKPRVKAANREQIQDLPVYTYKKPVAAAAAAAGKPTSASSSASAAAASSSVDECSICLGSFEDGDVVKSLPCLHRFHSLEIDQWLRTNEKCPICQTPCTHTGDT